MNITDVFTNAAYDAVTGKLSIPIADLGLTAAQADDSTGDVRLLMDRILRRVQSAYVGADPQPNGMSIALGNPSQREVNQFNQSITATFVRAFDESDVLPVPVTN